VALKLLALYPERIRSVVAYEPVMFRWLVDDAAVRQVIVLAESIRDDIAGGDPVAAALRFVDFWSGAGTWDALAKGRQQAVAARMRSVRDHFDALLREPLEAARLAQLHVPLMFMAGASTVPATARIAQILRRAVPRATHEVIPGMGHLGPVTHAADVNRRIVAFIAEHAESEPALA
jgi:pimeloyl-ACP methyl ester carboxylesterase